MLELENQFKDIAQRYAKLHLNEDFGRYELWHELTVLLSRNAKNTIKLLDQCNEAEIELISAVFEDIAYILKDHNYIDSLKELDNKFSSLCLAPIIEIAERYSSYE